LDVAAGPALGPIQVPAILVQRAVDSVQGPVWAGRRRLGARLATV
jgi:hypothetical protein